MRGTWSAGLQNPNHLSGPRPLAVQLVEGTLLVAKQVDDDVAVVQQNPAGCGGTLPMVQRGPGLLEGLNYVLPSACS